MAFRNASFILLALRHCGAVIHHGLAVVYYRKFYLVHLCLYNTLLCEILCLTRVLVIITVWNGQYRVYSLEILGDIV